MGKSERQRILRVSEEDLGLWAGWQGALQHSQRVSMRTGANSALPEWPPAGVHQRRYVPALDGRVSSHGRTLALNPKLNGGGRENLSALEG